MRIANLTADERGWTQMTDFVVVSRVVRPGSWKFRGVLMGKRKNGRMGEWENEGWG